MKSAKQFLTCLLVFVGCGLWVSVASAQDVRLNVDWSQKRWIGYPDSVGKIASEWKGKRLYVRVVVNWEAGVEIRDENPRAFPKGNKLQLCYEQGPDPSVMGKPVPSALAPVLLEFVITGIPQRNYQIGVSARCDQL
jgi:hypothetical protein